MTTLIVPDIHESFGRLLQVGALCDRADRVVFLGDWFDTFDKRKPTADVTTWLKTALQVPRYTFLWGNHDGHYAFAHPWFRCSGYDWRTQALLNAHLTVEDWRRFRVYTHVGPFLVSHAGFRPETVGFADRAVEATALDAAFAGDFHPLWAAGECRGGWETWGGPTWLDWGREFAPLPAQRQIVGHSQATDVRINQGSYCLDTHLQHVAWVTEDGTVTIEDLG